MPWLLSAVAPVSEAAQAAAVAAFGDAAAACGRAKGLSRASELLAAELRVSRRAEISGPGTLGLRQRLRLPATAFAEEQDASATEQCDFDALQNGNQTFHWETDRPSIKYAYDHNLQGKEVDIFWPGRTNKGECNNVDATDRRCWFRSRLLNDISCSTEQRCLHFAAHDGMNRHTYTCPSWIRSESGVPCALPDGWQACPRKFTLKRIDSGVPQEFKALMRKPCPPDAADDSKKVEKAVDKELKDVDDDQKEEEFEKNLEDAAGKDAVKAVSTKQSALQVSLHDELVVPRRKSRSSMFADARASQPSWTFETATAVSSTSAPRQDPAALAQGALDAAANAVRISKRAVADVEEALPALGLSGDSLAAARRAKASSEAALLAARAARVAADGSGADMDHDPLSASADAAGRQCDPSVVPVAATLAKRASGLAEAAASASSSSSADLRGDAAAAASAEVDAATMQPPLPKERPPLPPEQEARQEAMRQSRNSLQAAPQAFAARTLVRLEGQLDSLPAQKEHLARELRTYDEASPAVAAPLPTASVKSSSFADSTPSEADAAGKAANAAHGGDSASAEAAPSSKEADTQAEGSAVEKAYEAESPEERQVEALVGPPPDEDNPVEQMNENEAESKEETEGEKAMQTPEPQGHCTGSTVGIPGREVTMIFDIRTNAWTRCSHDMRCEPWDIKAIKEGAGTCGDEKCAADEQCFEHRESSKRSTKECIKTEKVWVLSASDEQAKVETSQLPLSAAFLLQLSSTSVALRCRDEGTQRCRRASFL
eukprot:TRINITY_DN18459_c0_g1_i2.p1 TRINITY_DN18459_c0_g1~~TRINITY_DN18459_c0_g1_i2.p1  ORF type:complete len:805 (-),score=247.39 TRINITY_DN18459_c0_g1_i2:244-2574(-)